VSAGVVARALRVVPVAAVLALLGAAMVAAAFSNPTIGRVPDRPRVLPTATGPPDERAAPPTALVATPSLPPDGSFVLPAWISWLVSALCAAALLAVVGSLLWLMLRDRLMQRRARLVAETGPAPVPTTKEQVRAAVEEGLENLDDADQDPRRAIIACWVRLEEAAAGAGTPRGVGDTSTDLVRHLLVTQQVSGPILDGLAGVYREARFATTHAVDAAMRDQARSAMRQLRDELSVGVR